MQSLDTFLPMARMRDALDIPSGVDTEDALLQGYRGAAESWLSQYVGFPIVDRYEAVFKPAARDTDRVLVRRPTVRRVVNVRFWVADDEYVAPDTVLEGNALPRYAPLGEDGGVTVFAPAGGWPEMVSDAGLWVTLTCGLPEADGRAEVAREAALAFIQRRRLATPIRENDAMYALADTLRDSSAGRAGNFPDGWDAWAADDGTGATLTYGGEGVTLGGVRVGF